MTTHATVATTPVFNSFNDFRLSIRQAHTAPAHAINTIRHHAEAHSVRRRGSSVQRRRNQVASGVALAVIAVAALVGSLMGSGGLDADTRFNAERLAAQSRVATLYGPAPLHGQSASAGREMRDMLRQFMNLDAMN